MMKPQAQVVSLLVGTTDSATAGAMAVYMNRSVRSGEEKALGAQAATASHPVQSWILA